MVVCAIIVLMWRPEGVSDVPSCTPDPCISFCRRKKIVYPSFISLFETTTTMAATTAKTTRAREGELEAAMKTRATICDGESDIKRAKDDCLNLPRRSLLLSLTNLDALLSGLKWKRISKIVTGDVGERASERAKNDSYKEVNEHMRKTMARTSRSTTSSVVSRMFWTSNASSTCLQNFSNVDYHCVRPTPEHAEAGSRQLSLQWAGCLTRCQRPAGSRLQSTSASNEARDGIGREEIPQSSVTLTSGALIGRGKRWMSSASAKEERLLPGLEFKRATPSEARTLIGRERIPKTSVVSTSASLMGAASCTTTTIMAAAA